MNINVHNLKPVSNFIAKSSDSGPVLCMELEEPSGAALNIFFHTEAEIHAFFRLMFEGRKLYREALREYKGALKNG